MKFPVTYFAATLLLALSVAADENKTVGGAQEGIMDDASDWWEGVKAGLVNATTFISSLGECGVDFVDQLEKNPDLKTADEAYEATWSYKDSDEYDGKADAQVETWTTSYGADEFGVYKSACEAVGSTAVWWEIPSGYTLSCATNDGSYTFHMVYNDFGDCYPATDACATYAEGAAAFAEEVSKEVSKDGNDYTCTESMTEKAESKDGDSTAEEEPEKEESEAEADDSSASMMKMTVAAVVATVVGTVVYL